MNKLLPGGSGAAKDVVLVKEVSLWGHILGGPTLPPAASHYCSVLLDEIKPMEPGEKQAFPQLAISLWDLVSAMIISLCSHLSLLPYFSFPNSPKFLQLLEDDS